MRRDEKGLTTVEVIVSIFIFGLILTMLSGSLLSYRANRQVARRTEANRFAQAELEALRDYPFVDLANRTDGSFIGFAFNYGAQAVAASSSARSNPNVVLAEPSSNTLSDGTTSLFFLKDRFYDDASFSAALRVSSDSGAGWESGLLFRYEDVENYYAVVMSASALRLVKMVDGVKTTLATDSRSFSTDQWYVLQVSASGESLQVLLNGSTVISLSDAAQSRGSLGIFGAGQAFYAVDDATLTFGGESDSWNFDSETSGAFPAGWLRNAPTQLSDLETLLSVSAYNGSSTIKQVEVEVLWTENGDPRAVSLSTLKAQPYETP